MFFVQVTDHIGHDFVSFAEGDLVDAHQVVGQFGHRAEIAAGAFYHVFLVNLHFTQRGVQEVSILQEFCHRRPEVTHGFCADVAAVHVRNILHAGAKRYVEGFEVA